MKDPLTKLFGSVGRVKILRFFLSHTGTCATLEEVVRSTKTVRNTVSKELKLLSEIEFLISAPCNTKDASTTSKKTFGYRLNEQFEYLQTLRPLLTQVGGEQEAELAQKIRKTGRIKAIIVSGVFVQDSAARIDIIIVGNAIKSRKLEAVLVASEAELGQELRYAVFGTNEFVYRLDIRDKLICDVLAGPHRTLVNRIGL